MPRKARSAESFYVGLGRAIRKRREATGVSLEVLGSECGGLARSTMSGIENGKQQLNVYQLYLIAECLEVNPEKLISEALVLNVVDKEKGPEVVEFKAENDSKVVYKFKK